MLKLPYYCASLNFSATLRNLLYHYGTITRIMLIFHCRSNFLGVMGVSLANLGYLKLPSQTSKIAIFYSSVA